MPKNHWGRFTVMVLAAQGLSSCALPPREAWQRIKDEGVLHALFVPRKTAPIRAEQIASSPTTAPQSGGVSMAPVTPAAAAKTPTAEVFPGNRGFVYSPFTRPKKLVNTKGFAPGEQALCPYTLELFIVPDYGQNSAVAGRKETSRMGPEKEKKVDGSPSPSNPAVVELVSSDLSSPLPSWPASPPNGSWVPGRAGYVYSPFAAKHQLVDVTGIAPGVEVKCPYTGKLFRVPEHAEVTAPVPVLPEEADPFAEKPATTPDPVVPPVPAPSPPADPAGGPAPTPAPPPTIEGTLPTAVWADGESGLVQTPFGEPGQLVDVTGKEAGAKVICPFSNKPFLVPGKK